METTPGAFASGAVVDKYLADKDQRKGTAYF